MKKDLVVFYHANCNDGTGGALAFADLIENDYNLMEGKADSPINGRFGDKPTAYFVPVHYSFNFHPELYRNRTVVFIDFTPSYAALKEIYSHLGEDEYLIILDHHTTAVNNIKRFIEEQKDISKLRIYFRQDQSGAKIARTLGCFQSLIDNEIAFKDDGNIMTNIDVVLRDSGDVVGDMFFDFLDVRDRWISDHPLVSKSDADALAMYLFNNNFANNTLKEARQLYYRITNDDIDLLYRFVEYGHTILSYVQRQAKDLVDRNGAKTVVHDVDGKAIELCVVSSSGGLSDAASYWNTLCQPKPSIFVGVVFDLSKEVTQLSIRSKSGAKARLLAETLVNEDIALNGGGHDEAAGARLLGVRGDIVDLITNFIKSNKMF